MVGRRKDVDVTKQIRLLREEADFLGRMARALEGRGRMLLVSFADIKGVAEVAYESCCVVEAVFPGPTEVYMPWCDLSPDIQEQHIQLVRCILDRPAASEKDWHNNRRARLLHYYPNDPALCEYEELSEIERCKVRLWRSIVHAFIG